MRKLLAILLLLPAPAFAAAAWVQTAVNNGATAYVNISPTAGNALLIQSATSPGGGSPTVTAVQAMSAVNGGGSVLATGTVPAPLATVVGTNYYITGAYVLNLPAGVASVLLTFNGGTPGTTNIVVVEVSGVATSGAFIAGAQQDQNTPGTTANAITSTAATVGSAPAYLLGISSDAPLNTGHLAAGTSPIAYTLRGSNSQFGVAEDASEASTGSYAATFTDATRGGVDEYVTTVFALTAAGASSCTHQGYTSAGALATPNGSSGSYVGKAGAFVTPDCSTVNYWQPTVGNFGTN